MCAVDPGRPYTLPPLTILHSPLPNGSLSLVPPPPGRDRPRPALPCGEGRPGRPPAGGASQWGGGVEACLAGSSSPHRKAFGGGGREGLSRKALLIQKEIVRDVYLSHQISLPSILPKHFLVFDFLSNPCVQRCVRS